MQKQRGRPKGRLSFNVKKNQSFGPLGDLIRKTRLERGLGLSDLADACGCSVQFVSNIEHGRAPLPWEKVPALAKALRIPEKDLEAANLSVRADFRQFVSGGNSRTLKVGTRSSGRLNDVASIVAFAAKDMQLKTMLERYQSASPELRARFIKMANQVLDA